MRKVILELSKHKEGSAALMCGRSVDAPSRRLETFRRKGSAERCWRSIQPRGGARQGGEDAVLGL